MTRLPDQLSVSEWHARFQVQAGWTKAIRERLYARTGLKKVRRALEVGCGTGVLTEELHHQTHARVYGLDIAGNFLVHARSRDTKTRFIQGDALRLPYSKGCFDLTFYHFLLLWLGDPLQSLLEMKRVTRSGCVILALAEPDYGGRIDFPQELVELGLLQTRALERQGADPLMGRKLAALFLQAGLQNVETGVLGGEWRHPSPAGDWESEWKMLSVDLRPYFDAARIEQLKSTDLSAWQAGTRVLFVPTFYAIGWVA